MEEIIKTILNTGPSGAALVVLAYVTLQTNKLHSISLERLARMEEIERGSSVKLDSLHEKFDNAQRMSDSTFEAINACRSRNGLTIKRK